MLHIVIILEHRNQVPPRFNERMNPPPTKIGDTIVLSCISQGIPPPQYLWFRESMGSSNVPEMLLNSERVRTKSGILIIQQARPEDAGRYVCHANNTAGSERVELEVTIISGISIRLQPQQVKFDLKKKKNCYHVIVVLAAKIPQMLLKKSNWQSLNQNFSLDSV